MSNAVLKSKFSIFSSLGMIPKASLLEEKENNLKKEFDEFMAYKDSDELARYKELDAYINSPEFEKKKREINSVKYQESEEYKKEKEYTDLKKSNKIKTYYLVKDSQELTQFKEFSKSDKLANYEELDRFFTSNEFEELKKSIIQQKTEKLTEIKNKQDLYKEQSKKYKWYFVFKKSKQLEEFKKTEGSKELESFIELDDLIKSNKDLYESKNLKKENPEEYTNLKTYQNQAKSSYIKNYFKTIESENYKRFVELDGGKEINDYLELEKEIQSNEFKTSIQEAKNLKFENTEEYKNLQNYKSLKRSAEIKQYYKFKNSEKLAIFNELDGSQNITDYEELEKYISSEEFKDRKKYLQIKDKFKLSEEYKQQQEYLALKKSDKIKWYFKLEKKNSFDQVTQWELTFEDDFTGTKLDQDKWLTGYYWGKTILSDNYVQANEQQFFTDKNLEIKDSVLRITTKAEKAKGKVWHPTIGFYQKDFDYTSGLINTGQSFRQKYGRFEAKIRINHSYPVHHAFWMLGEKITPEIDIFKYDSKSKSKISVANYWGIGKKDKIKSSVSGPNLSSDYFIYTLNWTPEKLIWKINNVSVYEITEGVPQEPMYVLLSSGIVVNGSSIQLPCTMEVDWVRVYQEKQ